VRARQERVPFVTLEDRDILNSEVLPLLGKQVALIASPEGAILCTASSSSAAEVPAATTNGNGSSAAPAAAPALPLPVKKTSKAGIISLLDCAASRGGAKAAACAQLEQLAVKSGGVFRTPPGCCVPFGTMELSIAALTAAEQKRYEQLLQAAETAPVAELTRVCDQLQVRAFAVSA